MTSFLIAPVQVGLERDVEPWLLPNDAFPNLLNAYIFRGRVVRKDGAQRLGSLCYAPSPLPGPFGPLLVNPVIFVLGAIGIVPGSVMITATNPFPTTETITDTEANGTLQGDAGAYGTIDYATGAISLTILQPNSFAPPGLTITVTGLCVYPAPPFSPDGRTPVMGIGYRQEPSINFEETIFFDQKFSYRFGLTGFTLVDPPVATAKRWNGTNSDFFWTVNARNPLVGNVTGINNNFFFVTNFNNSATPDPIRYLVGSTWTDFTPFITVDPALPLVKGRAMFTARCIVTFKNRVLFFNTWEGDLDTTAPAFPGNLATQQAAAQNYPNRLRYSWIGPPQQDGVYFPTAPPPTPAQSGYLQTPAGRGGFVDAATGEQITSVCALKDCILVKFETQSWRIVYTQNPFFPFEWQKINQEFGSDSTFSTIQFDDYGLTVGNRAISQDSSVGVKRIDEKIPDVVFEIQNDREGPKRVQGARDFYREQVYWSLPTVDEGASNDPLTFPNRILNYSYRTGSFAIFKDSFTALGKFQNKTSALWGHTGLIWGQTDLTWGGATDNQEFEQIAAGNQQGNVFLLQHETDNDPIYEIASIVNTPDDSIVVTLPANVTTVSHNIESGDFVKFSNVQGFDTAVALLPLGIAALNTTSFEATLPSTPITLLDEALLKGEIVPGTVVITKGVIVWNDLGEGTLFSVTAGCSGFINYTTGEIELTFPPAAATAVTATAYRYSWLNGRIFGVLNATASTIQLMTVNPLTDILEDYSISVANSALISPFTFGQVAYLTNCEIQTKQLNPVVNEDSSFGLPYVDLYMDGTNGGKGSFLVRTSDNLKTSNNPVNTYTGAQWTFSTDAGGRKRFWQRIFTSTRGEFVQITLGMNNLQMIRGASFQPYVLHGLSLRVEKSGRIIRTRY